MEFENDIIYGVTDPARNVHELAVASLTLMNTLQESEEDEMFLIFKYLDTYVKENPLSRISFKDINLEWFNVSEPLSFEQNLDSHIVVLDFFTYCCINCLHILPDLEALEEKYRPNGSPVVVIGIHSAKFHNEKLTKCVNDAIKKNNISHPVANDVQCKLWHDLGISCWPTLLIVGPGGLPLFVIMGEGKRDLLFKFVEASVQYFENIEPLNPKILPLTPQLHLPTKQSGLYYPGKVGIYSKGLVISDSGNNRILITNWDGKVEHVIGSGRRDFNDGNFDYSSFNNPQGVAYHSSDILYVADTDNHAIRKIDLRNKTVSTVAGNGTQGHDYEGGKLWTEQVISSPWDLCLGHSLDAEKCSVPNVLFMAMAGLHQIWGLFLTDGMWLKKCHYPEGTVVRLAGSGIEENRNTSYPLKAGFAQPSGISLWNSPQGQVLFIADSESSSIRQFSLFDGAVRRVTGGSIDPTDLFAYDDVDGGPAVARFQHPLGVAVSGDKIFVADSYNHKIKVLKKDNKSYISDTILGRNRTENEDTNLDQLYEPGGLCASSCGKFLYIADTNNFSIKEYNIEERKLREINIRFEDEIANSSNEDVADSKTSLKVFLPSNKKSKLNLKLLLNIPPGMHLTPEAKQRYSISCDDGIIINNCEGSLDRETLIPLEVDLVKNQKVMLHVTCTLFLCSANNTCTMNQNVTLVEFLSDIREENMKDFEVVIKIKSKL